jgi:hypothetical protein
MTYSFFVGRIVAVLELLANGHKIHRSTDFLEIDFVLDGFAQKSRFMRWAII